MLIETDQPRAYANVAYLHPAEGDGFTDYVAEDAVYDSQATQLNGIDFGPDAVPDATT